MATKRHQIFVGDIEPISCIVGDIWVDTSISPAAIRRCISVSPVILFSDMTMAILGGRLAIDGDTGRVYVNITTNPATLIRPANTLRASLSIKNMHTTDPIFWGYKPTVTINDGFPLVAGQISTWEAGIEGYIGAIYAVSATGIIPVAWGEF